MRTKQGGFTLLELVITLIILGMLLAMGLPAMSRMIQSSNVRTLTNELVRDLNLARSHASDLNSPITLCKTNTAGDGCQGAGTGTNWHQNGWRILADDNNDRVPNVAGVYIRITGPSSAAEVEQVGITGRQFDGGISFFPDGTVRDNLDNTTQGIFNICPNTTGSGVTAVSGRTVTIDERGNIRTTIGASSGC